MSAWTERDKRRKFLVFERDNYSCCYCGSADNIDLDHIIPLSYGGERRNPINLQTLCLWCNRNKGKRYPSDPYKDYCRNRDRMTIQFIAKYFNYELLKMLKYLEFLNNEKEWGVALY